MNETYNGIDYGMGRTNIDQTTGIRYGVISQHDLPEWFFDDVEMIYPEPEHVDDCDNYGTDDFDHCFCNDCLEPIGWHYESGGVCLADCLDSDAFIFASTHTTTGTYCSPCVPGAVSVGTDGDIVCYGLPPEWYDGSYVKQNHISIPIAKES